MSPREASAGTSRGRRPEAAGNSGVRLVAFDLDGVVWRGEKILDGAPEALEDVVRRGLDLRYVSNNSTAHRETVSAKLATNGLPAGQDRVFTSGFVTGHWLRGHFAAGSPVMVVGEEGLVRELRDAGLAPFYAKDSDLQPAAVVVGMDRSISFTALARAQRAIMKGALFVATNRDPTFPTPDGVVPGAGAIVAAVATAAHQEPVVMGKPSLTLAESLAVVTGVPASRTVFVGDRLSTDVAMADQAGMISVLVLTGISTRADVERARETGRGAVPDYVLEDLHGLPHLLDSLID